MVCARGGELVREMEGGGMESWVLKLGSDRSCDRCLGNTLVEESKKMTATYLKLLRIVGRL